MNRRGHLSHKVPNVKLRPAPAGPSVPPRKKRSISPSEEVWREQYAGESEDEEKDAAYGSSSKPWMGIVITFTGVDEKPQLSALVKELGGKVESALTVDVTHVVATGFGSPKYNYAVENRIPVMNPEWIRETHEKWLMASTIDLESMQEEHRLRPFTGLKIAISGIENLERRKQIVHWVDVGGGIYSKDLDRTCTHLISAKPTSDSKSSEKVKWALKEISTRESGRRRGRKLEGEDMKIIYEEWLWDCLAFRGRWKEELYDARKPRSRGKVSAEAVLDGSAFETEEPKVEEKVGEEPAVVKKRKREAMDSLVGEIISTAARQAEQREGTSKSTSDLEAVHPLGAIKKDTIVRSPPVSEGRREPERKPSLLHQPRSAAFEEAGPSNRTPSDAKPTANHPPTARTPSDATVPLAPDEIAAEDAKTESLMPELDDKFFSGLRFSHVIEEKCEGLEKALVAHGGVFIPDAERQKGKEVDYIVVRLSTPKVPTEVPGVRAPVVVTECWVEACCFDRRMFSPDDHLVFRPLPGPSPILGAESLNVHLSGFGTADQTYLRRLLKAIGGKLSEKMNRQTTHLVSATDDSAKARKAPEWGVKLVKQSWLLDIGRTGRIVPVEGHLFRLPSIPAIAAARRLDPDVSTANLSVVLDLGEPTYAGATAHRPSQRSLPVSPSRLLKMTPTHVDVSKGDGSVHVETASMPNIETADLSNILSPPRGGTERILNNADITDKEIPSQGMIGKMLSAPPSSWSLHKTEGLQNPLRGSSTGGHITLTASKKDDMTSMLRQLVEKSDSPAQKAKPIRRPRPTQRVKTTSMSSRISPAVSVSPQKARTPDIFDNDEASADAYLDEGIDLGLEPEQDETVRVKYVDSNAEKEKKKLLDAMNRAQRARTKAEAMEKGSEKGISPNKRARR